MLAAVSHVVVLSVMTVLTQRVDERLAQLHREILETVQIGPGSTFMVRLDAVIAKARVEIMDWMLKAEPELPKR